MKKIPLIKRFLQKQDHKQKVVWLALTNPGEKVKDDDGHVPQAWRTKSGFPICDGYKASRLMKGEENCFKVDISVEKSALGIPLFYAVAFIIDNEGMISPSSFTQTSHRQPSVLATNILEKLKVRTNRNWPGPKFFGFDRKDVCSIINSKSTNKRKISQVNTEQAEVRSEASKASPINLDDYELTEKHSWLGLKEPGQLVTGKFSSFYERKTKAGVRYFLLDGYVAHRGVETKNGKHVLIKCKVVANGALPLFICEAEDDTIETENVGTTVRLILESVNAVGGRNGSGQEFFGFYRKEVFRVLSHPELLRKDRFVSDKPVQDIINIRQRNAGPSSDLSKQSRASRNQKIDEIVKYASFGDLKSEFVTLKVLCSFLM